MSKHTPGPWGGGTMSAKQKTTYAIAILPDYYEPDIQGNNRVRFIEDNNGDTEYYDTIHEAREAIEQLENDRYYLTHGEAARPDYYVVEDGIAAYIMEGRGGDMSNYDWDDADCDCGDCNICIDMMMQQDREYVVDNATEGK
jgi:hypothetical protein